MKDIQPSEFSERIYRMLHPSTLYLLKQYDLLPESLKHMYCNDYDVTDKNFEKLIDLLGDLYFVEGIHRIVNYQVERSSCPTYMYQFSYDKSVSIVKDILGKSDISGRICLCHIDDLSILNLNIRTNNFLLSLI